MTTYASIHNRPLRVTGFQHSTGWRMAGDDDQNARELPFEFSITDDSAGSYLLISHSVDESVYADTWYETLEDAFAAAERQFGIARSEWTDV